MYLVMYVSTGVRHFSNAELLEILDVARSKNSHRNITGMLLYKGGRFMQVLEGPEEEVKALVEKIKSDPRHNDFKVIHESREHEREFEQWSMGFANLHELQDVEGLNNFMNVSFSAEGTREVGLPKVWGLLRAFRNYVLAFG